MDWERVKGNMVLDGWGGGLKGWMEAADWPENCFFSKM